VAHSLSRKKRNNQNVNRRIRNRARTNELKTLIRKLTDAIRDQDIDRADTQFRIVTKRLDQVASTSAMHKNAAARKKSRLARKLNAARTKTATAR